MSKSSELLTFWAAGTKLCIDVNQIACVIEPGQITSLPNSRPEIAGVANVRGEVTVAAWTGRLLGLDGCCKPKQLIVLNSKLGLLADSVGDMRSASEFQRSVRPKDLNFIKRGLKLGGDKVLEIDAQRLSNAEQTNYLYFPFPDLEHAPKDKLFILKDDIAIATLGELAYCLHCSDEATFSHHVNSHKNDFANWIEHVFGQRKLADQVRACSTKESLAALLSEKVLARAGR
jgi:chemotaxis signal transduction protein